MEDKKKNLGSYIKVVSFLIIEILALISFSLGNSFIFFSILSLVVAILTILLTFREIKKEGFANFAYFLFPILMYGFLIVAGNFVVDPSFVLDSTILHYFIPLGFVAISTTGYLISTTKQFNIKYALLVIYAALAIYVVINLIVTLVQFEVFHTLKYKDYYIYYDGEKADVPIGKMAYVLLGFSFEEVSISFFSFFPILLMSSGLVLFFINYKDNKYIYLSYLSFFIIGLITVILTINIMSIFALILFILVMGVILLLTKIKISKKVIKYSFISLGVVFSLAFAILVMNAQIEWGTPINGVRDLIANNALLNKLFNNSYVNRYNVIVDGVFTGTKMFGFPTLDGFYIEHSAYRSVGLMPSGSWLFDNFMVSGLFGSIIFIAALVFGVKSLVNYYKTSSDEQSCKILLIAFVFGVLTSGMLLYDASPCIFNTTLSPFCMSGSFMIMLFLISYTFARNNKINKQESTVETNKEDVKHEEENIVL